MALSGGTRIGHCLHRFLDHLEQRSVQGPDAIALILSDGWDVGDADLLNDGMRRLRGQVGRIVWCDPNAAAAGYQPQVQGLRLALPYVDDYLDFSTVASLSQLAARPGGQAAAGRAHARSAAIRPGVDCRPASLATTDERTIMTYRYPRRIPGRRAARTAKPLHRRGPLG